MKNFTLFLKMIKLITFYLNFTRNVQGPEIVETPHKI